MNTKVVRNISESELTIPDVGVVKPGQTITVPVDFNNANFEVVKSESKKDSETPTKKFNSK